MPRAVRFLFVTLIFSFAHASTAAENADSPWWHTDENGEYSLHLYFFWTDACPHCQAARPDMAALDRELDWLTVHSLGLTDQPDNGRRYAGMARNIGERAQSVPAFLFCGRMLTGYDSATGMGAALRQQLGDCRAQLQRGENPLQDGPAPATTLLPGFGEVDLEQWSLPMVTVTLGAMDSLNPCAFFVLLFLLSLLVHARSRARMLLVGGVFVGISGLVYFLFMAAWLNLFLVVGQIIWITLAAGALALLMGFINIKDFFFFKQGVSLSIPDGAKPGLFKRMRNLISEQQLLPMLLGTMALGVLANAYELLCTAGFPMVFTRILTLHEQSVSAYYAYLALYCLVYVVPLFLIVVLFALTLGQRKLTGQEGRLLKLMSGLMMAGLGAVLMLAPEMLNRLSTTLLLLAAVLAATGFAWLATRRPT